VPAKTMPTINTIKKTDHGYKMPKIERLLITNILIAGYNTDALVDCGAKIDLISNRIVQHWKLPLQTMRNLNIGAILDD
jgi:hypothetical protein